MSDLTEKQLEGQVLDLLAQTGWNRRYHTYRSKKSPSGFPDEVWVRERVIFAELKREKGVVSEAQKEWLRDLLNAGAEAYLIRPADLPALAKVLGARHRAQDGWWSSEAARVAAASLRVRAYAETGLGVAA